MKTKIWRIAALAALALLSCMAVGQEPGAFTLRPSTSSGTYLNPASAYDGSFTTYSYGTVTQSLKGAKSKTETWSGFSSAPPGASGMQLNINSSATTQTGGTAEIDYSLNGGTTFTSVYFLENTSRGQQTDSIALSNTQDLTKVRVKGNVYAFSDGTYNTTSMQKVYEIWISGTN
jgi:hypothetical protein